MPAEQSEQAALRTHGNCRDCRAPVCGSRSQAPQRAGKPGIGLRDGRTRRATDGEDKQSSVLMRCASGRCS
jgi:hypothetical protein